MYTTYPQHQNYGPQHNSVHGYGYAPMQQPMPVAAPVAQSAAASKGLLMVAGLAVVGAAAFGGVYLMNSNSQPDQTAASQPSTVFNIPSEINIPGLNTNSNPASPVIVNNPAPVRVVTPSAPRSSSVGSSAPVQSQVPANAPKPADTKPADTKPADTKPADTKPADTKKPGDDTKSTGGTTTGGTTTGGTTGGTTTGGTTTGGTTGGMTTGGTTGGTTTGGTTTGGTTGGTTTGGTTGGTTTGGTTTGGTTGGGLGPDDLIDYGGCACGNK